MEKIYKIYSKKIKCIINRRSKKNIILKFQNNELHISIPKKISLTNLDEILNNKKEWIYEKIKFIEKNCNNKIMFLGQDFNNLKEILDCYKNYNKNFSGTTLKTIYKEIFNNRIKYWSEKLSLYPSKIRIKKLKSAWGICYRNESITLNSLLIHCPIEIIDYVIVHELVHLRHMNHSKEFWNEILEHTPNYNESRIWLKKNYIKIFNQSNINI